MKMLDGCWIYELRFQRVTRVRDIHVGDIYSFKSRELVTIT